MSASVTLLVLENSINCTTFACLWNIVYGFYQHKQKKIFKWCKIVSLNTKWIGQTPSNTIDTHVNKIVSMGKLLKDLIRAANCSTDVDH